MKRYKLIKDYPGCAIDIGDKVIFEKDEDSYFHYYNNSRICYPKKSIEEYPEFWEEVIEKDYEILNLKCKYSSPTYSAGDIITHIPDSDCKNYYKMMNCFDIYSVKRLSDGEVFTIGDKLGGYDVRAGRSGNISTFKIENGICRVGVREVGVVDLRYIKHIEAPLFTTEDGVDIFDKNLELYWVTPNSMKLIVKDADKWNREGYIFYDRKNASRFIAENCKKYSFVDLISFGSFLKSQGCNNYEYYYNKINEWINVNENE